MLYNIDTRLQEIMHTPTLPFGNIDVILCGDLFQVKPIRDSWIFEQPKIQQKNTIYLMLPNFCGG